jgi:nitrogen fixation protein NifU and related proteins
MTTIGLYHKEMLRHAAAATGAGEIENADAHVTLDNPLCGDRVTMDVALKDGKVEKLGHKLHACVLCQASASILGEKAIGHDAGDLKDLMTAVTAMLKDGGDAPTEPWEDYAIFEPVIAEKNRHTCVLLPIETLITAIDEASSPKDA